MPLTYSLVIVVVLLFAVPVIVATRTRRLKVVVPIALLVTAGASFWVWTVSGEVKVLDTVDSVDGNQLVVTYTGGECDDQRSVSVDEDDSSVRIEVIVRSFASGCSDVGVLRKVAVTLDEPLGTRTVVNVGCTSDRGTCRKVLAPAA